MTVDKAPMGLRKRIWLVVTGVAVIALVAAIAVTAQEEFPVPSFLPADDQNPAPTPDAGQQVLVLEVALEGEGEQVTGRVVSQQIVSNFAPKSVARSAGEWEVQVDGEKDLSYLVPNPLQDVEIEDPENEDDPYDYVATTTLDWTLVVPLYADGQPLGATRVQVVDVASKAVIVEAAVENRPPQ